MSILDPGLPPVRRRYALLNMMLWLLLLTGGLTGIFLGLQKARAEYLLVLTFHGVTEKPTTPWEITYSEIQSYVRGLKRYGFAPMKPTEFSSWWKAPTDRQRHFLVTFDDGLESSAGAIRRLKAEEGIDSVLFVIMDRIGKPDYLQEDALRALATGGTLLELHGMRHLELTTILNKGEDLLGELREAKTRLEAIAGYPVSWLAYPFGEHNEAVRQAVASAGFSWAFSIEQGLVQRTGNPFQVPRIMYLKGVERVGEQGMDDWVPPSDVRTSGLVLTLSLLFLIWSLRVFFRFNELRKLK